MRVEIPVTVYVSHMTDGTVHRDVFPTNTSAEESTAEQRALATMMLRERDGVEVDHWDAYPTLAVYDEK